MHEVITELEHSTRRESLDSDPHGEIDTLTLIMIMDEKTGFTEELLIAYVASDR